MDRVSELQSNEGYKIEARFQQVPGQRRNHSDALRFAKRAYANRVRAVKVLGSKNDEQLERFCTRALHGTWLHGLSTLTPSRIAMSSTVVVWTKHARSLRRLLTRPPSTAEITAMPSGQQSESKWIDLALSKFWSELRMEFEELAMSSWHVHG